MITPEGESKDQLTDSPEEAMAHYSYAQKKEGLDYGEKTSEESLQEADRFLDVLKTEDISWADPTFDWKNFDKESWEQKEDLRDRLDAACHALLNSNDLDGKTKGTMEKIMGAVHQKKLELGLAITLLLMAGCARQPQLSSEFSNPPSPQVDMVPGGMYRDDVREMKEKVAAYKEANAKIENPSGQELDLSIIDKWKKSHPEIAKIIIAKIEPAALIEESSEKNPAAVELKFVIKGNEISFDVIGYASEESADSVESALQNALDKYPEMLEEAEEGVVYQRHFEEKAQQYAQEEAQKDAQEGQGH